MPPVAQDLARGVPTGPLAPQALLQARAIWQGIARLLKRIAARIDLSDFPGSCCG
jgi:hypothetical protein